MDRDGWLIDFCLAQTGFAAFRPERESFWEDKDRLKGFPELR